MQSIRSWKKRSCEQHRVSEITAKKSVLQHQLFAKNEAKCSGKSQTLTGHLVAIMMMM